MLFTVVLAVLFELLTVLSLIGDVPSVTTLYLTGCSFTTFVCREAHSSHTSFPFSISFPQYLQNILFPPNYYN